MAENRGASSPRSKHSRKRLRCSSTPVTPHTARKRVPLRESAAQEGEKILARRLFVPGFQDVWTESELKALVEFVLFHGTGDHWPTHKQKLYWKNAAEFVKKQTAACHVRSRKFSKLIAILQL